MSGLSCFWDGSDASDGTPPRHLQQAANDASELKMCLEVNRLNEKCWMVGHIGSGGPYLKTVYYAHILL